MSEIDKLQSEYNEDVKSMAKEIEDEVRAGDLTPEDAHDRLWENVDGSQWVIYTYRAKMVAAFLSDNPDACADELGPESLIQDQCIHWSGIAMMAMLADVRDAMGDLDEIEQEGEDAREAAEEAAAEAEES
jgi:hypothetical protein